jgi:hypothetical protein
MIDNRSFTRGTAVASVPRANFSRKPQRGKSHPLVKKLVVTFIIVVPVIVVGYMFLFPPEPPSTLLTSAKQSLQLAADTKAVRYSAQTYRNAEELMKAGWMEMAYQTGRLAPLRDFDKADSLLLLSIKASSDAISQTRTYIENLRSLSSSERSDLSEDMDSWRAQLNGSLARLSLAHYLSSADMALRASDRLMGAGEYEDAREQLALGRNWLKSLAAVSQRYDDDYTKSIPIWRNWVQQTLDNSRAGGGYAVIVDKSAHKLYLVHGGKIDHVYNCELGYNSAHQKLFAGDGATPEGMYRVSVAKPNGSRYHSALLINFPNDADRKRFSYNKENGIISGRARIGNLIEIHGNGGQGKDWTEGCVALTDREVDHLMRFAGVGTPVTIVGKSDRWP